MYEQFSKLANIYFLIICILQVIHEISISGGKPVILLPLLIVISINSMKNVFEDLKRKRSDDEENNRNIMIYNLNSRKFEKKMWKNIREGDIVQVLENELFPSDLIFIAELKENDETENDNICYIDTKNLDGETSLKYKQAVKQLTDFPSKRGFENLKGRLECDPPNDNIYEFDARLHLDDGTVLNIDKNSFLLRGCSLKQTHAIYGLVTYTGHNTKIMRNAPNARFKVSRIEEIMNNQIIVIFIMLISISLFSSIFNFVYLEKHLEYMSYLSPQIGDVLNAPYFLARVGTWILILTNFVPISLLVTLEMIKFFQGMVISWDIKMIRVPELYPTKVQTSTLNEELGQVKFIFSDKTGTLTKNCMEFKKMSIGSETYGLDENVNKNELNDRYGMITNFNFYDEKLYKRIKEHRDENTDKFLLCLSLCHTAFSKFEDNEIQYHASSPDELALINAARRFGYVFLKREVGNKLSIEINGEIKEFIVTHILEFTSDRKRLSVIVQDSEGKIFLFSKGADSVMKSRISQNKELIDKTESYLLDYARSGLRTLIIAYKEVSVSELENFEDQIEDVFQSVNKETRINEIFDSMEQNLCLLGSTAIEDKLQDDVAICLEEFINVGIKVIVLTGDKVDTAKSIAFSCKLLTHEFILLEFREGSSTRTINNQIDNFVEMINAKKEKKYGLIIANTELAKVILDEKLSKKFYYLITKCNSVLCCRVSPLQKAQIVKLVKQMEPTSITLAIGDGANDVNMITSAHIGVAIFGVEGRQAVTASDYAIGQFSFLKRLLFVHGREAYRRNSLTIGYNFYKNILFVIPQFWFGIDSIYSGQTLYDPWIYQLYNTLFAVFPIVWFGIYDQEFDFDDLENRPHLYIQGMLGLLFNGWIFWKWILFGLGQGYLIYIYGFYANQFSFDNFGRTQDLFSFGSICYSSVVLIANFSIFSFTNNHNIITLALFFFGFTTYYLSLMFMSRFNFFMNFGNFAMIFSIFSFYLSTICVVCLCILIDYSFRKLPILFGLLVDPERLTSKDIEIKMNKKHVNLQKEINNEYLGEAFSQEKRDVFKLEKRVTIRKSSILK